MSMLLFSSKVVSCSEKDAPAAPHYPFWFKSPWHGHDIPSVRRGYEVYRAVCATCHSMKFHYFRRLVNTVLPEKRVKEIAASYDITDGPNDMGEMYTRPGIVTDAYPKPYPNDNAARYANNGACPPDLSNFAAAKHGGCDYIMSLLTCYREPPAGVVLRPGLYYNPYFHGGALGMPPPLQDGQLEYEDGTPATVSQMAKDVTQFLSWSQDVNHDQRKLLAHKFSWIGIPWAICVLIWKRQVWSSFFYSRTEFTKPLLTLRDAPNGKFRQ